jgi:Na+-driven multidrug efflux pump
MSSSNTNDGGNSGVACTDDYYSYDTVSHFRDPGATLLIITVACCFLTVAIIPCVLRWGEQYDQYKSRRKAARKQRQETSSGGTTSDDIVVRYDGQSVLEQTLEGGGKQLKEKILGVSDASSDVSVSDVSLQAIPNWHNSKNKQKNDGDDDSVQSRKSSASSISAKSLASFIEDVVASSPRATHRRNKLAMTPADRVTTLRQYVQTELQLERGNSEEGEEGHIMVRSSSLNIRSDVPSLGTTINEKPTSIYSSDAFSVDQSDNETLDLRMCCGPSALWKPWVARQAFDKAVRLFEVDKDLKRLIGLAVPFTGRAFLAGVGYNLHWVFISRYLGTCELAAAAVVDIYQGVTTAFLGGMISAQISLSAQALGVGNNYLAGQYVQQAQILFTTFFIPAYIFWWFFVYPLTLRIGQPSNVAQIAQSYARVELINNWLLWLLNSIHGMYEVTDHEVFSSVSKIVTQYIYLAGLIPTLIYVENATLVTVAMLGIISNIMGIIWAITYPLYKGWLKSFIPGWLCSFSLSNISAVWHICRAGIPLGFGSLMAYCEWELNTIFVAHTGQAQVAAYALLGTLWETFESFTEGIGDAAVIRVALHLGQGDPRSAKISGYRSAILGLVVACLVTSIFWIFGHEIPQLFSTGTSLKDNNTLRFSFYA